MPGVHKHFGDRTRVQHCACRLRGPAGGLTFMLASGCGKTTLLSVITGLLDPSDGGGGLFREQRWSLPAKERILFAAKTSARFPAFICCQPLTAAGTQRFPLIAGWNENARKQSVVRKALLDQLGLDGRRDALPVTLLEASATAWRSRGL